MSKFLNGYLIEYIIGHTYVTVTSGEVDQFGRFIGKKMVFVLKVGKSVKSTQEHIKTIKLLIQGRWKHLPFFFMCIILYIIMYIGI